MVLGVGGRSAADPQALLDLATASLARHGLVLADVTTVATLDRRADHPGVQLLGVATDAGILPFTAEELAAQPVDHPSETVSRHTGTGSVAEAATRAAGATPLGPPVRGDDWVVVVGQEVTPRPTSRDSSADKTWLLGHHGDVEVERGMLDFAVNVHGEEPPGFVQDALREAIADLARYPDPRQAEAAVAEAHGVPAECVRLTHGAAEAFTLVAQQPWRRPVVVHPQFTEPEAALLAAGHHPERLVLHGETGFRLPSGDGADRHPRASGPGADLVVVGNPTNPTSRLHAPAELLALRPDDGLLVVDEAFMDAVEDLAEPTYSLARRAADDPGLMVVRSLTKTYALAGLRVGYVVGHPGRLEALTRRRTPWPVGTLAAAAAVACVSAEGRAYAARVRDALPQRRALLESTLARHGFRVVPEPRGPFLLAWREGASEVRESLRARGVAVRRGDTFPGLGADWLRFAVRGEAAVAALDRALGEA